MAISDGLIFSKEKRLLNFIHAASCASGCITFQFSYGWFYKFKKRHALRKSMLHLERASVSGRLTDEAIPQQRKQLLGHAPENIN